MALGSHWEWRGFGNVSNRFAQLYRELPLLFETQVVEDSYLWIPGLSVNAKLRSGADGDLKFKRLQEQDGELEKWVENPEEIFDFPLSIKAWTTLSEVLKTVNIELPHWAEEVYDRDEVLDMLKKKGCRIVSMVKQRDARLLKTKYTDIKVEWATILGPQQLVSIALESGFDNLAKNLTDEEAKKGLSNALQELGLQTEPLQEMSYLKAIEKWAKGEKI